MTRRDAARWAAPAAFLAAVTIVVLLVRAGLNAGGGETTVSVPTATAATTTPAVGTTTPRGTRTATTARAQYHIVQAGETFGTIASQYGTTVERLEELNPGVSSSSLSIGQRIRVK